MTAAAPLGCLRKSSCGWQSRFVGHAACPQHPWLHAAESKRIVALVCSWSVNESDEGGGREAEHRIALVRKLQPFQIPIQNGVKIEKKTAAKQQQRTGQKGLRAGIASAQLIRLLQLIDCIIGNVEAVKHLVVKALLLQIQLGQHIAAVLVPEHCKRGVCEWGAGEHLRGNASAGN